MSIDIGLLLSDKNREVAVSAGWTINHHGRAVSYQRGHDDPALAVRYEAIGVPSEIRSGAGLRVVVTSTTINIVRGWIFHRQFLGGAREVVSLLALDNGSLAALLPTGIDDVSLSTRLSAGAERPRAIPFGPERDELAAKWDGIDRMDLPDANDRCPLKRLTGLASQHGWTNSACVLDDRSRWHFSARRDHFGYVVNFSKGVPAYGELWRSDAAGERRSVLPSDSDSILTVATAFLGQLLHPSRISGHQLNRYMRSHQVAS